MKPASIVTAGVALSLSLIACGGSDGRVAAPAFTPTEQQTAGDDPVSAKPACDYVTEAEASQVFETEMKYRSNDGGTNCIFDGSPDGSASIDYTISDGTDGYDIVSDGMQPVDGIGDRAAGRDGSGLSQVVFTKGNTMVTLTVSGNDIKGGGPFDVAKKFALFLAGKL
ncbi:MAG TPA: hypothetical protein VM841_13630 [Actinomycetota bacterium]|nr:hypothetical protein [Actinomycetota bacterium]